ncbi:MAG: hypothetical protein HZC49_11260 [Nitrospirae bacterium]|nr:hypothetical protein [Nitrospirota bacterium]
MNRNLKIFLANGVPFGAFMGTLFSNRYGISTGIQGGLMSGLVFGFLMFIILGFLHSRAVRKISGSSTGESMSTFQVRTIKLRLPFEKAFDLCIKSIGMIRRCRVLEQDRSHGKIIAKSSVNWKTWGDTISFDIVGTSDEVTDIKVSSRPTSWSTIVDYGKNLENVESIVSFLRKAQ